MKILEALKGAVIATAANGRDRPFSRRDTDHRPHVVEPRKSVPVREHDAECEFRDWFWE